VSTATALDLEGLRQAVARDATAPRSRWKITRWDAVAAWDE
jgi:hypothetical protein